MHDILKSVKLDHEIMKSHYPVFAIALFVGVFYAVMSKRPVLAASIVVVLSAPLVGTFFSVYEKNNLANLYGILPLGEYEVVIGTYLYALLVVIANGIVAGILSYAISVFADNGASGTTAPIYLTVAFLFFCLILSVTFPLYFRYPFSKVYAFSNVPFYLVFVITLAVTKKTGVLGETGQAAQYLASHQYAIVAAGLGLGFLLLATSCLLSCAIHKGIRPVRVPAENPDKRLCFVDNLRTWMIVLVVLQHLAEVFGTLFLFMMLNQAYFMGLLFLLSGYFTPGSFEHKGPGTFLRDRLLRLGLPTLLYAFIISPIGHLASRTQRSLAGNAAGSPFSIGPMWFAVMLLIFDLAYLAWRMIVKSKPERLAESTRPGLTFPKAALFTLALAVVTYLLRIAIPYGTSLLGFPSLEYLPQYLGFFVIGVVAFRRDWLRTVPGSFGALGFALAVLATVILFPVALIGLHSAWIGHGTWQSGIFALWDSIFAVGMSLALITFFRRFLDGGKKIDRFLSRHSFTVYVIHAPIIVSVMLAVRGVHAGVLPKFGLAAVISLPLCFLVAFVVQKIPFADRIL